MPQDSPWPHSKTPSPSKVAHGASEAPRKIALRLAVRKGVRKNAGRVSEHHESPSADHQNLLRACENALRECRYPIVKSECAPNADMGLLDIGYRQSAIRCELHASLPVYLVRSARTVLSSAPLLDNWSHSKVQQAIATRAEAAKIRTAICSNLLSRGEAASAQTFHKRVSGSASTFGRLSDDGSVATRARSSFSRQSGRLLSARI